MTSPSVCDAVVAHMAAVPPSLAQTLRWPSVMAESVNRKGLTPVLTENLRKLVLTSSYSGMGAAEVVLRMLSWEYRDRFTRGEGQDGTGKAPHLRERKAQQSPQKS